MSANDFNLTRLTDEKPAIPAYDSDEAIAARHRQLRGTDRLLYYPPEHACPLRCAYNDNDMGEPVVENGKVVRSRQGRLTNHPCFLGPNHDGDCVFSSECLSMLVKGAPPDELIQADVAGAIN